MVTEVKDYVDKVQNVFPEFSKSEINKIITDIIFNIFLLLKNLFNIKKPPINKNI